MLVVGDGLVQRGRQAHGQAAVDLAVDDHGVDDVAAVVDGHEPPHLDLAGGRVDVDGADVRAEGEGQVGRIVVVDRLEAGLHAQRMVGVGGERDLGDGLAAVGRALHEEAAVLPLQVVLAGLQEVRRDLLRLVPDLAGGHGRRCPGHRRGAAGVGAQAVGRRVGVAFLDGDVGDRDAQLLGDDLGEGGHVALALGLDAQAGDDRARGMDPDLTTVEHLDAQDVEGVGGASTDDLGEGADADAHELAPGALLGLLLAQAVVVDHLHRPPQRGRVVARVVVPARGGVVGELLGLDEVLLAQLGGVHADVVGVDVDHALDGVHRLGDPERAAIRHATGRLVGVDAVDLHERILEVVRPRDDVEQASREARRVGRRVGVAVVGDGLHLEGRELAVLRARQLRVDVVVTGERVGLEVLRAVLDPLDRLAHGEAGHDGQDVARIDRHLAAEAAADVMGLHPDLVLRGSWTRARAPCGWRAAPGWSCGA